MLLLVLAGAILFLLYRFFVYPLGCWKRKGIPYVQAYPLFGNFFSAILQRRNLIEVISDIYRAFPNNRYVGLHQGKTPILLIRDPDLIKLLGIKEFDKFRDHNAIIPDDEPILGKNLFNAKGEKWHNLRATLSPTFTGSKMRTMFILMDECAKKFVSYFEEKGDQEFELEIKETFSRFANDVIGTCAFGVQSDSLREPENQFFKNGKETVNFSGLRNLKFLAFMMWPGLMKMLKLKLFSESNQKFFSHLVSDSIKYREENGIVRPDLIHLLLEAKKNDKLGVISNENDITAQAIIFFFAGFEAVSVMLSFLFYELAINPEIQQTLRSEIDELMEECKGNLKYDTVMNLKYLDMVISEAMRKWTSGGLADRVCNTEVVIEPKLPHERKLIIEPGMVVWFPIFPLMRDEKHFPDPDKFIPERFADKTQINDGVYMPFGIGPRICVASRFALMELKVLTVMMIHKFEIEPVKKTLIPMELSTKHFGLYPKEGKMWLGIKKRNTA